MKTIKLISLATLVIMGSVLAGCAKEQNQDSVTKDNLVVCTTTVSLEAEEMKALSIVGDKGVKTFAVGEQVALRYYNTKWDKALSQVLSDSDISADGKTATLTFTLNSPERNGYVYFCYPAAMAKYDTYSNIDYKQLIMQKGTLASLSANYDLAIVQSKMSGTDLPASVTLSNQLAILAITLKNSDGSNDITGSVTGLTLSDGTDTYTVSRSASADPIYVAIKPVNNKNITITASSGLTRYTKSVTGKTYARSNGYNVSWRMEVSPMLNITNPLWGQVICSDGKNYDYAALPSGVTAVAMIAYVDGDHGLAIALADEKNTWIYWSPAMASAAAHAPVFSGGTWKIASQDEWKRMFKLVSGKTDSYQYDELNSAITGVGGTALIVGETYWTSSEGASNTAYIVGLLDDGVSVATGSRTGKETGGNSARACLVF